MSAPLLVRVCGKLPPDQELAGAAVMTTTMLSTEKAGGFVGTVFGPFARQE